jgi:hypothetical protein
MLRVLAEAHQIAFPMAKDFLLLNLLGPLMDRDTIGNAIDTCASAFAKAPFSLVPWEEFPKLFLFLSTLIDPSINGLMANGWDCLLSTLKPSSHLLRGPVVALELRYNKVSESLYFVNAAKPLTTVPG